MSVSWHTRLLQQQRVEELVRALLMMGPLLAGLGWGKCCWCSAAPPLPPAHAAAPAAAVEGAQRRLEGECGVVGCALNGQHEAPVL
jgi:hypothetical protein